MFTKNAALFALSALLGCLFFFMLVVDPTLSNPNVTGDGLSFGMHGAISGAIMRRVYPITYGAGGVAAFFLLLASFGSAPSVRGCRRALILTVLLLGCNAANDLYITKRIHKARLQLSNPDQARPSREEYRRWQQASTVAFASTAACCLLGVIFLLPAGSAPKAKGKGGK
jgi:hypothetical protein